MVVFTRELTEVSVIDRQKVHMLSRICLDQPVAVKIIQKINQETASSVIRESNILGWKHKNIIKILKVRQSVLVSTYQPMHYDNKIFR